MHFIEKGGAQYYLCCNYYLGFQVELFFSIKNSISFVLTSQNITLRICKSLTQQRNILLIYHELLAIVLLTTERTHLHFLLFSALETTLEQWHRLLHITPNMGYFLYL